jgi:hypothetical protein
LLAELAQELPASPPLAKVRLAQVQPAQVQPVQEQPDELAAPGASLVAADDPPLLSAA